MGGWGGTPYFDASFLLGYAAYGLLLLFEYFFIDGLDSYLGSVEKSPSGTFSYYFFSFLWR
jgi:hypothetical protein